MTNPTKFRVQAGSLVFEMEGDQKFVEQQLDLHREHIELILSEQAKIIKSGKLAGGERRRRGRPVGSGGRPRGEGGRRPGRQPVIIRESTLELKPRQTAKLGKYLAGLAENGALGKDATVFAVAYYLCDEVLSKDTFTAGDVISAMAQLGETPVIPAPDSIDVVQMLRNLAAASIGKEWVRRNSDGTFSLTEKGKAVGVAGEIVRPRGRRPAEIDKNAPVQEKINGRRGRPRKVNGGPAAAPESTEANTDVKANADAEAPKRPRKE